MPNAPPTNERKHIWVDSKYLDLTVGSDEAARLNGVRRSDGVSDEGLAIPSDDEDISSFCKPRCISGDAPYVRSCVERSRLIHMYHG